MKKKFLAVIGLLVSTVVNAADIPSRSIPTAPVSPVADTNPFFVGVHFGSAVSTHINPWYGALRVNVRGGYEFSDYARVEANYDYAWNENHLFRSHTLSTNLIGQYRVSFLPVVPYVLAGAGYRFSPIKNEIVYNLGAGVRYEITSNLEADLRYKYVTDYKRSHHENVITLGVNYKF